MSPDLGLGRRIPRAADLPSPNYPVRQLISRLPSRTYRYWFDSAWVGDQNGYPQCVAYAHCHAWASYPTGHGMLKVQPKTLYDRAQQIDEWPGEDYGGTSVNAGAKAGREMGLWSAWYWAWTAEDLATFVIDKGPAIIGVNWYSSMFTPDLVRVAPSVWKRCLVPEGAVVGGHAIAVTGANWTHQTVRITNSWGRDWGNNGRAQIRFTDLQRLLDEQGEACCPTEE